MSSFAVLLLGFSYLIVAIDVICQEEKTFVVF